MASGITRMAIPELFPVYHFDKPTKDELKMNLQNWCQEQEGTSEYEARLAAARRIEDCYTLESEELVLEGLNLTSLPEKIGALESLQYLDLQNNQLTTLPVSLCELTRLKELILDNNPMQAVPLSLYSIAPNCLISTKGCDLDRSVLQWGVSNVNGRSSRLATSTSRFATSWEPNPNWKMDFNDR